MSRTSRLTHLPVSTVDADTNRCGEPEVYHRWRIVRAVQPVYNGVEGWGGIQPYAPCCSGLEGNMRSKKSSAVANQLVMRHDKTSKRCLCHRHDSFLSAKSWNTLSPYILPKVIPFLNVSLKSFFQSASSNSSTRIFSADRLARNIGSCSMVLSTSFGSSQ